VDLTDTITPKSDQLDAVDLIAGPRTFTIKNVSAGSSDQPVNIHLEESPRPWRPSKSMRRVLVAAWGADGKTYVGRRVTLFCDPNIEFGGIKVGGIRISHLSHLGERLTVPLLVKRGKTEVVRVEPLVVNPAVEATPEPMPEPTPEQIAACTSKDQLKQWWKASSAKTQELIKARADELTVPATVETAKQAFQEALDV
jgi:hypothetical protein